MSQELIQKYFGPDGLKVDEFLSTQAEAIQTNAELYQKQASTIHHYEQREEKANKRIPPLVTRLIDSGLVEKSAAAEWHEGLKDPSVVLDTVSDLIDRLISSNEKVAHLERKIEVNQKQAKALSLGSGEHDPNNDNTRSENEPRFVGNIYGSSNADDVFVNAVLTGQN